MKRRTLLAQMLALGVAPYVMSARAQGGLPNKPITLVVPFAPGGNLDVVARAIAPALEQSLGRNVIVDNRPGAGGVIGATAVSRAEPDGSTLLVTTPNAIVVLPKMTRTSFKLASFSPVGLVSTTALVIVVKGNDTRFKDIGALLAHARANPGKTTTGHAGPGTTNHMATLQLEDAARIQLNEVPYKGSAPALIDLMGGQIDMVVDQLTSSAPHIQSGALRALAVMSRERDAALPKVPTLRESGLANFEATTATGLLAPAGTPAAVIETLNSALRKVLAEGAVKSRLLTVGSVAQASSPQELLASLQREDARAQTLAAAGRLKAPE
ncbi:Tripartite-type tricarboxylate transporter, receptor component TctC [Cupriavidus sp. OV038]|jgi:tripartite-type tricarboxylate transporter receptor subunit TctC|uniref:Bug family tripartite tricarboxylate transporter substrate binding protein n=2 Tax=Pseudomonadota TaxID=1224 RepID=UPI0008E32171|nr:MULTISPECIES: tripartite tricarboxylate transporter substrate binding protein [unclassified Cupriavidus]SFC97407.1 Tripartite-type tricarboxylate transporter, receptor component TctC [Cupriavidus sp. OV038]SFP64036.1 Tripartite-type tricarboxylate transporter, receptor component TctC [Cupriavidus sp. OV096]